MADSKLAFNSCKGQSTSLRSLIKSIYCNYYLILQMTKCEVVGRYKGSIFGIAWSFFTPLSMLAVYTFVFSQIFKSRWENIDNEGGTIQFAVIFFVGLIVQGFFSEVLNRSPVLIISNRNYVKKVVFPLEILPLITVGTALFHSLISLCVLLATFLVFNGYLVWTLIFIPLIFLPLILFTLGFAWILATLGVYLRDIGQTVNIFTTLLVFLSPVFYPVAAVPEQFRPIIMANPLTFIIEQARVVLLWGHMPDWSGIGIHTLGAAIVAWIGYILFQKTREGFSDVL